MLSAFCEARESSKEQSKLTYNNSLDGRYCLKVDQYHVIESTVLHSSVLDRGVHSTVPRIKQDKSTEQLTALEGSDLTLECTADGFPVPQINWEKYGGQLPVGRYSIELGMYGS